jgi:hypothetical protein
VEMQGLELRAIAPGRIVLDPESRGMMIPQYPSQALYEPTGWLPLNSAAIASEAVMCSGSSVLSDKQIVAEAAVIAHPVDQSSEGGRSENLRRALQQLECLLQEGVITAEEHQIARRDAIASFSAGQHI